jgi:hypothetical protein
MYALQSRNPWKIIALLAAVATALAWGVPFLLSLFMGRPATRETYGILIYLWPAPFLACITIAIVAGFGWGVTSIARLLTSGENT